MVLTIHLTRSNLDIVRFEATEGFWGDDFRHQSVRSIDGEPSPLYTAKTEVLAKCRC